MEAQKTADGSAGRLETSKVAMAEETSTQYKPPTCEDVRASPKQQKEEQDDWGSFAKDKKKKNEGAAAVEETPEPVVVEKPADDGWDDWRTTTTKKGKKAKKSSISAAVSEPLIVPLLGPNSVDLLAKKNRKLDIIVGGEAPAPPSSSSRPSSVTWSIPPASKTTQSDAPTRVSQATTAVAAQSRIRIDPSGSDVAGTESQQTTSPPRGLLRRRSKSPQSRPPMGPQHTAHTCSEEDDDEWLHLEDEITPWDSASRPRQTARPRTTRPPVVPPSQYIRPTRETSTSREGQRTPRRRPHVVKVGHGTIEPLPTYPPFSMYPGYDFPYMSMPPRPYPGPYMGSVPKPFSPYVPSMISGTTAVPTPPELPFQRYPSPPRRRRTPSPPPAPAPALAPPPTPAPSLPPPPPPPLAAPEPSQSTRDLDPIALVESYLEALKESKEKELLDANRILSWIDRRSRYGPLNS
ncbi:hypothetical protein CC80DRAFT_182540 [Byssothecium circinans]|uniref:Uncharacterized protein n=1 Tax=Byssothecium circinans TaxID=147558 RepID=A0A6A5TI08_9PLEO|nr:hypothetical protein CC80DRAFT_182540 [Byssothecium circinans]